MVKKGKIVMLYGDPHLVVLVTRYLMTIENLITGEIIVTDKKNKDVTSINVEFGTVEALNA